MTKAEERILDALIKMHRANGDGVTSKMLAHRVGVTSTTVNKILNLHSDKVEVAYIIGGKEKVYRPKRKE